MSTNAFLEPNLLDSIIVINLRIHPIVQI